jgi:hypothetical protein
MAVAGFNTLGGAAAGQLGGVHETNVGRKMTAAKGKFAGREIRATL